MSKPNENEIDAAAHAPFARTFTGDLIQVGFSRVMGGSITIECAGKKVSVDGLSEEMARSCGPLLFRRVTLTISPEASWISIDRAAFESGLSPDVLRGWAQAGYVAARNDNGLLLIEAASLRAYAHRYWKEDATGTTAADGADPGPTGHRDGGAS